MGKTPFPPLSMDILQSPPPSETKICYNKNCVVECDSQTLLLPSQVFFSVCQVMVNGFSCFSPWWSLQPGISGMRLFPCYAGSGQVGSWLARSVCRPAPGLPGIQLIHPPWYTCYSPGMLVGPHTVALVSKTHQCAPLRFKCICL